MNFFKNSVFSCPVFDTDDFNNRCTNWLCRSSKNCMKSSVSSFCLHAMNVSEKKLSKFVVFKSCRVNWIIVTSSHRITLSKTISMFIIIIIIIKLISRNIPQQAVLESHAPKTALPDFIGWHVILIVADQSSELIIQFSAFWISCCKLFDEGDQVRHCVTDLVQWIFQVCGISCASLQWLLLRLDSCSELLKFLDPAAAPRSKRLIITSSCIQSLQLLVLLDVPLNQGSVLFALITSQIKLGQTEQISRGQLHVNIIALCNLRLFWRWLRLLGSCCRHTGWWSCSFLGIWFCHAAKQRCEWLRVQAVLVIIFHGLIIISCRACSRQPWRRTGCSKQISRWPCSDWCRNDCCSLACIRRKSGTCDLFQGHIVNHVVLLCWENNIRIVHPCCPQNSGGTLVNVGVNALVLQNQIDQDKPGYYMITWVLSISISSSIIYHRL